MKRSQHPINTYLAEVTEGLEFVSETGLRNLGAEISSQKTGEIRFRYSGDMKTLLKLKTIQAVSIIQTFGVPRPRGLLDNTNIRRIISQIEQVRTLSAPDGFQTFFIAAAGSDSTIMQRIKAVIADATGLRNRDDKGDLWIRIRPGRVGEWEVLIRLSPRPQVTRSWRVCNLEGALNAATAHAMIMLTDPQRSDVFVNLGCGSGTLLIERQTHSQCHRALGFDNNAEPLRCASANITASGFSEMIDLLITDMTHIPLPAGSATALAADLPFGQLVGTHEANQRLYPVMLSEAARIAKAGAKFVLMTHEVRLMESLLPHHPQWELKRTIKVNLRGLHPRIYVLHRH